MIKSAHSSQILLVIALLCSISDITLAQKNDLNHLILAVGADKTPEMMTGNTGGAYSLASISNIDSQGNPCMGYGDPQPDHILTLQNDFAQLQLQVNSGGSDTTLIIKHLETNNIRCGFGQNNQKDAVIQDNNWTAGTYQIWVGSINPNQRSPYRLLIQP
jgi:hypothetical protein